MNAIGPQRSASARTACAPAARPLDSRGRQISLASAATNSMIISSDGSGPKMSKKSARNQQQESNGFSSTAAILESASACQQVSGQGASARKRQRLSHVQPAAPLRQQLENSDSKLLKSNENQQQNSSAGPEQMGVRAEPAPLSAGETNRHHQAQQAQQQQQQQQQQPPQQTQANICAACCKPIRERYLLMALDKQWHEDCLKCACCECRLGEVGSSLFEHSNTILCRRDFLRIFGPTGNCAACKRLIPSYELVMRANENAYHLECFSCQNCQYKFCVGDQFHLTNKHKVICVLCHTDAQVTATGAPVSAAVSAAGAQRAQAGGPDDEHDEHEVDGSANANSNTNDDHHHHHERHHERDHEHTELVGPATKSQLANGAASLQAEPQEA